jgi:Zn finger protein HypA/HybF involved in hydrogenase expression
MPYFIDDGNCVRKGTKEAPGEQVKCHEGREAATAHMRALYAAEDEKAVTVKVDGVVVEVVKGGRGSGWHKPPEGTHTAENAPNFAGGPGADRKYGAEDEPAEGQKHCKCTKCDSIFTLPKGKQCKDVECPGCGGRATQTSPRRDKPAEGEEGGGQSGKKALSPSGAGNVHGEGSMLGGANVALGDGDPGCKCPHCGEGLPCSAKACPNCNKSVEKVERREDEKAVAGSLEHQMETIRQAFDAQYRPLMEEPARVSAPWYWVVATFDGAVIVEHNNQFYHVWFTKVDSDYTFAPREEWTEVERREQWVEKVVSLKAEWSDSMVNHLPNDEKSFISYKSSDGHWRWATLSNWAVVDKEREIVTQQAYKDAIAHAQKTEQWGELDLVHVNGTDMGDCDMMFIQQCPDGTAKIGGGGTWHDTAKATRTREAIQAEPEHWGVSIKFRYNPAKRVRGVYTGDIVILKHSILPQKMAASYGTAIAVQQGGNMDKQLSKEAEEALRQLNVPEAEIAELAEKNKALPTEENVAEKEDTAQVARETVWSKLGEMLGIKGTVPASTPEEARKAEEVSDPVQIVEEPIEKAQDEPPTDDPGEVMKALAASIVGPLSEAIKAELGQRDERIAALEATIKGLSEGIEEKVAARLADVPPGARVAPTMVGATAAPDSPEGLTFGRQSPATQKNFLPELMKSIEQASKDTVGGVKYQA